MESKSDFGNGPVINMERVPITEGQKIHCSDDKRANGIGNGEIPRRIKNIPVLEERRLLALERHIKRKRRRRPYVKKIKSLDKTEHQLGKTMTEVSDDPVAFDYKDKRIHVSNQEGKEDCLLNKIVGTVMAALDKYEENQTDPQSKNELIKNFEEAQSTKKEVGKDKEQSLQFDKLVKYLLDGVKIDILNIVEDELNKQSKEVEEKGQIKKDEGAGMEVKQEGEILTPVKEVNTSPPKDALMELNRVNDKNLKKEKENLQNEGLIKCSERAKDPEIQTDRIRDENTGQSSSKPKELKQKDSESEAIKSNELVKDGSNNEQTNVNIRNKLVLHDNEDDDEEDDDDGFMPRKLFFFSFSEFKKEETSA